MSALTPDETILGLLAAQPQHGYQLLESFDDPLRLGNVWKLGTSQLYAVLKRLERQGWITGEARGAENAPPRTEYAITDGGWTALRGWLNDPQPSPSVRRVRVEFLSRLYIAQTLHLSPQSIINHQREACRTEIARIQEHHGELPAGVGALARDLIIAQLEALMTWIEHCETVLAHEKV
jgi:DNA-binding PadR family transcriptional regulator